MNPVVFVCALSVATNCVASEFIPGHVYVTLHDANAEGCAFGEENWILQIDPVSGDTCVFAEPDAGPGLCSASGLAMVPGADAIRALNLESAGQVLEFGPDGSVRVVLDSPDGLNGPYGTNAIAYDPHGDLFVLNSDISQIVRFPGGEPPGTVFADFEDGVFGRGALAFASTGDLFYCSELSWEIIRIDPSGQAELFDVFSSDVPVTLALDNNDTLFVGTNNNTFYGVYRYGHLNPDTRILLTTFTTDPLVEGLSTGLALGPDNHTLYLGLADSSVGGYLYAISKSTGDTTVVADFSIVAGLFEPRPVRGIAVVPLPPGAGPRLETRMRPTSLQPPNAE